MSEVRKSDLIYFQNELLQDLKKIDIKFTEKIAQIIKTLQSNKLITEQKFEMYNDKISEVLKSIESNKEYQNIKLGLENLKIYTNEENTKNCNKISYIEKDVSDLSFKFDNLISSFISAPGLIGKGCKYNNLKSFYENTEKNIIDLQNSKDKNNIDLNDYKKKLETLVGQFKLQIDNSKEKYFSFCKERIEETKKEIFDKFQFIEERIENMRLDNGKHSFDLIKKSEELENRIIRINNITNEVDEKMKEEMIKYQKYNKDLIKNFESQKEEFKIIKIRFSELSEFIKDVRFIRNLNNYNSKGTPNKEYDTMDLLKNSKQISKKLNFNKKQKITETEENKYLNNQIMNNNLDNIINNNFNNEIPNENNKVENNNENKKKYNIKLNIKDKGANNNINVDSIFNSNNINITKNNYNINNNYTINTISKTNNNNSRNFDNNNERMKTVENSSKKSNYSRKEDSNPNSNIKTKRKNLFIRIQSQFTLKNQINNQEFQTKITHTQHNFYNKDKNFNEDKIEKNLFVEQPKSGKETLKFRKILDKNKKIDNEEILKIISKIDKNNYLLNSKAYKNINNKILMIEERIKEINNSTKKKNEKINIQIQKNFDLINYILIEIDSLKSKYSNKYLNSPVHINKSNMPFIDKKTLPNNIDLTDRNSKQNLEKRNFLSIQDRHNNISSGKILNIIEPYLIKKFKSNNN